MHSAPEIKGWCPGALSPMQSDDGLLMRPKVVGSRLTLAQAREIAAIAGECGNGLLDLSQRAQLQMRGLGEATREEAQARLKAIGLLAPDAATESVLNVIASPLTGGAFDANEIAARLANALVEDRHCNNCRASFSSLSTMAARRGWLTSPPISGSKLWAATSPSSLTARAISLSSPRQTWRLTRRSILLALSSACARAGHSSFAACARSSMRSAFNRRWAKRP